MQRGSYPFIRQGLDQSSQVTIELRRQYLTANSEEIELKILSYQGTPHAGDIERNLEIIARTAKGAKYFDVDVLVFPELFVTGYNIDQLILTLAEPVTGDTVTMLKKIAQQSEIAIIVGFPEKDQTDVFNSAVAVDSKGNLVGHHRKVFLFGDKEKSLFKAGERFNSFELNGHRCGMTICYDIEFPESVRTLAQQDVEIVFNPTANMVPYFEVPKTLARARALENGVFVIYANLSGEENGLQYTGLSAIIGPDGLDLARAGKEAATIMASIGQG